MSLDNNGQYENELIGQWPATTAFAALDLLPTMRACPDLTAAQAALPDTSFHLTRIVVLNRTAASATLHVARDAAAGAGGRYQPLAASEQAVQTIMRYSPNSDATSVALETPAAACDYSIQVSFRLGND